MKVELMTCSNSPQCNGAKMYLDMMGVDYVNTEVTHEQMEAQGFDEMPILMIDEEVVMVGFDATKLSGLFK